jgi:methylenetetrahydrofolate dehydrogenase (NAD+)
LSLLSSTIDLEFENSNMSNNPTSCKVVLAANIAKKLQAEVAEGLAKLSRKPHLVGFLANKDPAARMYADWTGKTCIDK